MPSFESGETIICNIEVRRKDNNQLYDPATSVKIDIWDPSNVKVVDNASMLRDGVGLYHYDYTPVAPSYGTYSVRYKLTDGLRVSIHRDTFSIHG